MSRAAIKAIFVVNNFFAMRKVTKTVAELKRMFGKTTLIRDDGNKTNGSWRKKGSSA